MRVIPSPARPIRAAALRRPPGAIRGRGRAVKGRPAVVRGRPSRTAGRPNGPPPRRGPHTRSGVRIGKVARSIFLVAILLASTLAAQPFVSSPPWDPEPLGSVGPASVQDNTTQWAVDPALFQALRLGGVEGLDPESPTRSALLDVIAPATTLVGLYDARLLEEEHPLRHALGVWQAATGLTEDPLLLHEQLAHADRMEPGLQRALGILLYALADTTLLQSEAIASLADDDVLFLLDYLDWMGPDGSVPTDDPQTAEELAGRFVDLGELVDMGRMMEAARILATAVAYTAGPLERIAEAHADAWERARPLKDAMRSYLEEYSADAVAAMGPVERLGAISAYLRMLAEATGLGPLPPVTPVRGPPDGRLSTALGTLADAAGFSLDETELQEQLRAADALPGPLQDAVGRLVTAHADVVRALNAEEPPEAATYLGLLLRFFATLEETYPTLLLYHHVYRASGAHLGHHPLHQGETLDVATQLARLMADPATPLVDVLSIAAYQQGLVVHRPEPYAYDVGPGGLGRAMVAMYRLADVPPDAYNAAELEAATAQLARPVEAAAARILWSQVRATEALMDVLAPLLPDEEAWALAQAGAHAAMDDPLLASPEDLSPADWAALAESVATNVRYQETLHLAASWVAEAVDEARRELAPHVEAAKNAAAASPASTPSSSSSNGGPSHGDDGAVPLPGLFLPAAQQSQAVPLECQRSLNQFANCDRDIFFYDTQFRTVVITGPGDGFYRASDVGGYDHTLWIDLGGDDTYFTAAAVATGPGVTAAAGLVPIPAVENTNPLRLTAVKLEMSGNDRYITPEGHSPNTPAQAVADGPGTLAFLVDVEGDDLYWAETKFAQGVSLQKLVAPPCPANLIWIVCPGGFVVSFAFVPARHYIGGIALFVDDAGLDTRVLRHPDAQGQAYAGPRDQTTPLLTCPFFAAVSYALFPGVPLNPVAWVVPCYGLAVLLDREAVGGPGHDVYEIGSGKPISGQAGAQAYTAAFLVDAQGDDVYRGGSLAGIGRARVGPSGTYGGTVHSVVDPENVGGLAIFADLEGTDTYAPSPVCTGGSTPDCRPPRENGRCTSGIDLEVDLELGFVNNEVSAIDTGNPTGINTQLSPSRFGQRLELLSLFIDLDENPSCSATSPLRVLGLEETEDNVRERVEEFRGIVERFIENPDLTEVDRDGDGWPDLLEEIVGTDPDDPDQYPAGLPAKPEAWPPGVDYPAPVPGNFPVGSAFLVEIPGLFALGDVANTRWTRDHTFSIDLGGDDWYVNGMASGAGTFHLDVGLGNDFYDGAGRSRVQAHGGILIDDGGDDIFVAGDQSQASATPEVAVPTAAILANLAGNDIYVAGAQSQGYAAPNLAPAGPKRPLHVALFLDFEGDDTYVAPQQGQAAHAGWARGTDTSPLVVHGAFMDWLGRDAYVVDDQAKRMSLPQTPHPGITTAVAHAYWSHHADLDGYDRYTTWSGGHDVSHLRNDRYEASATRVAVSQAQALHVLTRIDADASPQTQQDVEGEEGFALRLPGLRVAVGDAADTTYRLPYALVVDLGGDDTYLNNAGASTFSPVSAGAVTTPPTFGSSDLFAVSGPTDPPRVLAGLLLDLEGDDVYDDGEWLAPEPPRNLGRSMNAAVVPGGSLTAIPQVTYPNAPGVDRPENANRLVTQGAGFLGVGFLVDLRGNDRYTAHRYAQGAGLLGVGVLWDRQGDDAYGYDGALRAGLAASGGQLSWMDRGNGRWDIFSDIFSPNMVTPPIASPLPLGGQSGCTPRLPWRVDHADPARDGAGASALLVWASHVGGDWGLWRKVGTGCANVLVDVEHSNQTQPRVSGNSVVYVDDQGETPTVRLIRNAGSTPTQPVDVWPSGRPQQHPDVFEGADGTLHVVWSEYDATSDLWGVWYRNVAIAAPARLLAETGERPRIDGSFAAWQRASLDPVTGEQDWGIYGMDVAASPPTVVTIDDGAGNQVGPDVGSVGVAYVDEAADGRVRVWYRDGSARCTEPFQDPVSLAAGFAEVAFDATQPTMLFAVRRGHGPDGIGSVHDVLRANLGTCSVAMVVNGQLLPGPRFLQGAAIEKGLGLLIDEAGQDQYRAWEFSQGAAFGVAAPPFAQNPDPLVAGTAVALSHLTTQGTRGLLLDLDGSDSYKGLRFSQGAVVHGLVYQGDAATAQPVAAVHFRMADRQGVLFDLRGHDEYTAGENAQGFAGWTLGSRYRLPTQEPPTDPTALVLGWNVQPYLVNSVGLLLDTGGTDRYTYARAVQQLSDDLLQLRSPINVVDEALATAQQAYRSAFPQEAGADRNNKVWRQKPTEAGEPPQGFGLLNDPLVANQAPALFDGWTLSRADAGAVFVSPGGLGVDLAAYETYGARFQELVGPFVSVTVAATWDGTTETVSASNGPRVHGDVTLSAQVNNNLQSAAQVRSVEYTARGEGGARLLGVVSDRGACGYCLTWATDTDAWPDGDYAIQARVHLAPPEFGTSVGYVEAHGILTIDNPPRIRPHDFGGGLLGVRPLTFSPSVFPGLDRADSAAFGVVVSRHADEAAPHGFLRAEVFEGLPPPGGSAPSPLVSLFDGPLEDALWLGTWDGHVGVPPVPVARGDYHLRVTATDDSENLADPDPARTRSLVIPFAVDPNPPGLTCVRPDKAPVDFPACNGQGDLPLSSGATGSTQQAINLRLDFLPDLTTKGSQELARIHVFHHHCPAPQDCPPVPEAASFDLESFSGSSASRTFTNLRHGDVLYVAALTEDVYGNVEASLPSDVTVPGTFPDALRAVFERKLDANEVLRARFDLDLPEAIVELRVDGAPAPALPLVGPRSDAVVVGRVKDGLSGIERVELTYLHPLKVGQAVLPVSLERQEDADGNPLVDVEGYHTYHSAPLKDLPDVQGWPEGVTDYIFRVTDQAGNVRMETGFFLLDVHPPEILPGTEIRYPRHEGYVIPGDPLEPVVVVSDDIGRLIGSRARQLTVTVDASDFDTTAEHWVLPRFQRSGGREFFTGELAVMEEPGEVRVVQLKVTVRDEAGNEAFTTIPVVFGKPEFHVSAPVVVERSHDRLVVEWTTTKLAAGRLEYGTTAVLGEAVSASREATDEGFLYRVEIEGLTPKTTYFLSPVATDDTGRIRESPYGHDPPSVRTLSGIGLALTAPSDPDAAYRDPFPVRFEGQYLADPERLLDYEVAVRPLGTDVFFLMGRVTAPPGPTEFVVDPLEFTDGAYEASVSLEVDGEKVTLLSTSFLLDRRRPQMLPESPLPGAFLSDPNVVIRARVADLLSGVDPHGFVLTVNGDGGPVPASVFADGRVQVQLAEPLPSGPHAITLEARDRAGNVGALTWHFTIDREPPVVVEADAATADGRTRFRPGDDVMISVLLEDASPIGRVWLGTSNVSSVPQLELDAESSRRFAGRLILDKPGLGGQEAHETFALPLWAQDIHGHRIATPAAVPLLVDLEPPRLESWDSEVLDGGAIRLHLQASEAVEWSLEAVGAVNGPQLGPAAGPNATDYILHPVGSPRMAIPVRIHMVDAAGWVAAVDLEVPTAVAFDQEPPSAPTGLRAAPLGDGRVELRWEPATDDTGIREYQVIRSAEGQAGVLIGTVAGLRFVDAVPAVRTAEYWVAAVDLSGKVGPLSESVAVEPRFASRLMDAQIAPPVGTPATEFVFRVTYRHPLGDPPEWIRLHVNDVPHPMERVGGADCSDGCVYVSALQLPPTGARHGPPTIHYEGRFAEGVLRYPYPDGEIAGPLVLTKRSGSADNADARVAGEGVMTPGLSALQLLILVGACMALQAFRTRRQTP